jgi:hypothetical protein
MHSRCENGRPAGSHNVGNPQEAHTERCGQEGHRRCRAQALGRDQSRQSSITVCIQEEKSTVAFTHMAIAKKRSQIAAKAAKARWSKG